MATVPEPNPSPAPQPPRWLTLASTALKLAVLGLIGVAGWWLVSAYRDVLPGRTAAATGPAAGGTPGESEEDWLLATGGWSIGETPWQATRATVAAAELEPRLKALRPAPPAGPVHPLETEVIAWLKRSAIRGTPVEGRTEYTLAVNRTRFRGVVESTPAGDRLLLGQIAWPGANADWELIELVPVAGGVAATEPLLPIPAGATSAARRWANEKVVAELIGPVGPDFKPADEWASAGWIREPAGAGAPAPSERLRRAGVTREVWRFAGPSGRDYLLVFRPNTPGRPEAR